ncbi:hypothetical protein [Streptomyces sp. NPDC047108]|uniref:hypothetical protein n=1 Tax=Streptomyces sp. NPDC047108 TaxID=3155025 RepID=UPI0033E04655
MKPGEFATAWDHSPTRYAWFRHMAMNLFGLICWVGTAMGAFLLALATPTWTVILFGPIVLYAAYRTFVQCAYFVWGARMQRILCNYSWQVLRDVPRGLKDHPSAQSDKGMWFEFRNPANPEEKIPLVFINHIRSYWWLKRIGGPRTKPELKAQIEPLWFAGDPRFFGVVAASGRDADVPKRMHVLYQRGFLGGAAGNRENWDASPDDLERARRSGARIPQPGAPEPGLG